MFKKTLGCLIVAGAVLAAIPSTCFALDRADVDAYCAAMNATYSTSTQRCVCNSGYIESNDACVLSGGTSSSPGRDYEAERRAQEQADAARRAEEERQAELECQHREAENKRRIEEAARQAKFLEDRDAAAGTLRGSTGTGAVSSGSGGSMLRGSAATSGGSGLRGSSADTGLRGSQSGMTVTPNIDPMVVDARVSPYGADLLSQVPELERSPAADRIRKGFQALMTVPRDWPVALAWWQEALQRDPNNAALMRSVDLAQWMVDSRKRAAGRASTPTDPAIAAFMRGDASKVKHLIDQAKMNEAIQAADAERMTNIVNKQVKQRAAAPKLPKLSPKSATMAQMATAGDRALSEEMLENGLLYLNAGLYEAAEKMFQMADFFRPFDQVAPSSPSATSNKTPSNSGKKK